MTQPDPFPRRLSFEEKLIKEHSRALVLHSLVSALGRDGAVCQHYGCMRISSHWVVFKYEGSAERTEFTGCEEHARDKNNHMGYQGEVEIRRNRVPDTTVALSAFALGEREEMP
jgi:hypothetical protein